MPGTKDFSNSQKKIAVINDLSGYGRCSLTVALPIISAMKIQCCPVPTAILSNHTGFDSYFFDDYTDHMQEYIDEWKKLELHFDGILTGFLGSEQQIAIVTEFIKSFRDDSTKVIVDPIMGDDGKPYATYTPALCDRMKELAKLADILTPNLTEACILTDTPYDGSLKSLAELEKLSKKLMSLGRSKHIVITGIRQGDFIANCLYDEAEGMRIRRCHSVGSERPGTGDVFSSIIAADAVNDVDFSFSVHKASAFIKKALEKSIEMNIPKQNGVCFETLLHKL